MFLCYVIGLNNEKVIDICYIFRIFAKNIDLIWIYV